MSRRHEDFDEFCDPDNPRIIKYEEVVEAAKRIRKYIPVTPIITSHYQKQCGINIFYKLETIQRTGSFKERGALNALELLPRDRQKMGVVVASLGNQAMGVCYYGRIMGIPVTVIMPTCVPVMKLQMCHDLGAKVVVQGHNLTDAQKYARAYARDKGVTHINARDYPDIMAGYGTIALEILEQVPALDAVMVPVGTGGLAAGIATVIKHAKPNCLVYGVQTERLPTFYKSLQAGEPITLPYEPSIAEGIAMPYVGVNAFRNAQNLLDKVLLVKEDWIARAILHLIEQERLIVEGAGACPLAAILGNMVPELKTKNLVIILSGGNIDAIMLGRSLDRGRAAEGRLVKFKVCLFLYHQSRELKKICFETIKEINNGKVTDLAHVFTVGGQVHLKDLATEYERFTKLLGNNGYNIIRQFQDRIWIENDIYRVEMKVVCETRGLEHALELKRLMEKVYVDSCAFETEPFSDDKTCPCYAHAKCS